MPIKIGFPIERSATMKLYAPVILEALRQRCDIFLLCGPDPENSWQQNPAYRPTKKNIHIPHADNITFLNFGNNNELVSHVIRYNIRHVVTTDFSSFCFREALLQLNEQGLKLFCLQWYADYLATPPELLERITAYFVYSNTMTSLYKKTYPSATQKQLAHFVTTGNPVLDQLPALQQQRTHIKQHYGIPETKKVVTLFTQNLNKTFWYLSVFKEPSHIKAVMKTVYYRQWRYTYRALFEPNYADIIYALKKWCMRNNAILVVKSRYKHHEPLYIHSYADLFLTDTTEWYPYRSLELNVISDCVFGMMSTGVLETIAANTYNITICVPEFLRHIGIHKAFYHESLFNRPGVSQWINYQNIPSFLKKYSLDDLTMNPAAQNEYRANYLGFNDFQSSRRIMRHIQNN